MKATGSICALAVLATAGAWLLASSSFVEPVRAAVVVDPAPPRAALAPEPQAEPLEPALVVAAAPAAEAVHEVVDPIEDRGGAMLWEIDALGGTPFDESIVMPFD